jgi:hypothetical protein
MKLETDPSRVLVDGRWLRFGKPVLQAERIGDTVLVIFDYMYYDQKKPAQNLVAFDLHGKELWKAENPTDTRIDAYTNFLEDEGLRVGNFAGYSCTIDLDSGKLIEAQFTK